MNTNLSKSELSALVASAKAGDEGAFATLYEQYFNPLYRYVLLRVSNPEDADDITQAVFLKFYKNLNNWNDQGFAPSAYLYSIARSTVIDFYRKNAKSGSKHSSSDEILELIADSSQTASQDVIDSEERMALYEHLKKLPDNYQQALLLRYMQNLSTAEVAHVMQKSDVATRKMLSRATEALRRIMHNSEAEHGEKNE